jgi:LysM repeat protein
VQKGESLYYIHKTYNVPLDIIKKENPSTADGLSIGEEVRVPISKNIEAEVKANGNYIHHEVLKKQTLYSIAKLYKVKQKEIIAANPELANGLKEGQVIKIPVVNIKKEESPVKKEPTSIYKTHKVKKGETLYSLSKLYKTSVDSIKLVNDGLKQGLKLDEVIYVPIKINPVSNQTTTTSISLIEEKVEKLIQDTGIAKKKPVYSIALMLPFYLDENDEITEHRSALEEKTIYPKSKYSIEFYNGFLLALDSISTDSAKFKLHVYDTKGNDSTQTKLLLLNPEMKNMDMIVGPLYANNFRHVIRFGKMNNIPVISPVKQSNKILLGNNHVFKVIPSKSTIIKKICTLVVDSFKTENLMAIEYDKAKEKSLVDLFIKTYNGQILGTEDTTIYSSIKKVTVTTGISEVINNLVPTKNNIIFVPASSQTFVTNLFNQLTTTLNGRNYKDYTVTLIGLEDWMKYENIDLEYFQKLNLHYCATRHIDYDDSVTISFIDSYKQRFETYPSKNTFLGFDIAYYFGNSLMDNGSLYTSTSLPNQKGMSIHLDFLKTGIESGFENRSSYLLRFNEFSLEKIYGQDGRE